MKKLLNLLLTAMTIIMVSCSESFDDGELWSKINSLDNRVTILEQLCVQMNTNISSLQTIISALQQNEYITSVVPILD